MSIENRIIAGWRLPYMPPSERTGTTLPRELIEQEQRFGLTARVAWAYAHRFPALLNASHPTSLPNIHPLHCSQGVLRAAVITYDKRDDEALKNLPHIDFVQTSSPQVCRLLAGRVQTFHVNNRDALETIKYHHQGVSHVYAREVEPSDDDHYAKFPITYIPKPSPLESAEAFPPWFTPTRHREDFIPLLKFDHDIWLCWSIYTQKACLVEGSSKIRSFTSVGPADVIPARVVRPWMFPGQVDTYGGRGWAATARYTDQRVERLMEASTDRRWLLLDSFERTPYNNLLVDAWRERKPMDDIENTPDFAQAHMVSLEILENSIQYSWIGNYRVLRLRDNVLTQLTEDHDMLYAKRQSGEVIDEETREMLSKLDNIVVKAIPKDPPDQGTSDLRPGDRYILIDRPAQRIIEQALAGQLSLEKFFSMGSPHDIAQRALNILDRARHHNAYIVLVIDSDAQVWQEPDKYKKLKQDQASDPYATQPSPTVRALIESPGEYDGRFVHTRGVLNWVFEQNRFAGAWFEPTVTPTFPMGSWLVEMRGTWHSDGTPRGHFGLSKSLIRGEVDLVSIDNPERVRSEHLFRVTPYIPLKATAMIERRLTGWTCQGKWLNRMGGDCRLPIPETPDRCRAEIVYCVDQFGAVGLFSWEVVAEFKLDPKPLMPQHLLNGPKKGDFIETTGLLTPHESDRDLTEWPSLEGGIRVVPPAYSRSPQRHVIPNNTMLQKAMETLGRDGKIVKIFGEIAHTYRDVAHKEVRPDGTIHYRHESIAYNILYATQIFDADGTLLDL